MIKKGLIFGIIILLILSSTFPNTFGNINDKKNETNYQSISDIINDSLLDLQYIYNITENLSYIIFTAYNESAGELAKGRAFGSKGELKAADLIFENMTEHGLWTWKEPIENTKEYPNLASKTQINERNLVITNNVTDEIIPVTDCYISQRGNLTYVHILLEEFKGQNPVIGLILEKLLTKLLFPINGSWDQKYNLYDTERLTHNFSYKGLEVKSKLYNYSPTADLIRGIGYDDQFVFIDLDRGFTSWPWPLKETKFNGFIYKTIQRIINKLGGSNEIIEQLIWTVFYPNCKAVIIVDSNNDTYNMGSGYTPIPVITVNKTIGWDMYENPQKYYIDFYINQSWNESVESYNVIGQLNGTNTDKTIIISSLYDSWWCQGTGDAAIGMAIVLGIIKYFNDTKITPKCNLKFIAFGGEEQHFKGAFHYEEIHRNEEDIPIIIDVNQVGFTPLIPENIKLQIWTNNQILNSTIGKFAENVNYTNRTGVGFLTRHKETGGPSNTNPFALAVIDGKRSCDTILFVKTGFHVPGPQWLNHHRDGLNHSEGDVIKYFNWTDTSITGELIWEIIKNYTIDLNSIGPTIKYPHYPEK